MCSPATLINSHKIHVSSHILVGSKPLDQGDVFFSEVGYGVVANLLWLSFCLTDPPANSPLEDGQGAFCRGLRVGPKSVFLQIGDDQPRGTGCQKKSPSEIIHIKIVEYFWTSGKFHGSLCREPLVILISLVKEIGRGIQ